MGKTVKDTKASLQIAVKQNHQTNITTTKSFKSWPGSKHAQSTLVMCQNKSQQTTCPPGRTFGSSVNNVKNKTIWNHVLIVMVTDSELTIILMIYCGTVGAISRNSSVEFLITISKKNLRIKLKVQQFSEELCNNLPPLHNSSCFWGPSSLLYFP